jgi:hypothetical protein
MREVGETLPKNYFSFPSSSIAFNSFFAILSAMLDETLRANIPFEVSSAHRIFGNNYQHKST